MTQALQSLQQALTQVEFADVTNYPAVKVDLRYGSTNNILTLDVYGGFQRALLHREAAQKFLVACKILQERHPGLNFLIYDSLRPNSAQKTFWQKVVNTDQQKYFADPAKGSIHSFGFAIDLGLADGAGQEIDMGTEFDNLTPLAEPVREEEFLSQGKLKAEQVKMRRILRSVMEEAGFRSIQHEWWHFDALPPQEVRGQYRLLE